MHRPPVRAVVWDFDNTLVDTRARNRSVTRTIVASVTGRDPDDFAALRTQAAYDRAIHHTQNWQELYRVEFALDEATIRDAGRMWTAAQLDDETGITWFEGIAEVVRALRGRPQAIVSMNTSENILAALDAAGLRGAFDLVVGCEEVAYDRQKPSPDGLLHALDRLADGGPGTAFYIGDHPIDAQCAANANDVLEAGGHALRVVSIGAAYGADTGAGAWPVEPAHRALSPPEILRIVDYASDSRTPS